MQGDTHLLSRIEEVNNAMPLARGVAGAPGHLIVMVLGLHICLAVELYLRISILTFLKFMSDGHLLVAVSDSFAVIDAGNLEVTEVLRWTW